MDTTTTRFVPAILCPLPMHHGVVAFGLVLTALVAVSVLIHMFRASSNREIF